ncbi:MAG: VWA domain-containing protein [Elusimicrobia bacterium]|nr:VWA domain-containing protein [Elusimicrobiota bacterium]
MRFSYPWVLALSGLALVLGWGYMRREKAINPSLTFPLPGGRKRKPSLKANLARWAGPGLKLAAMLLIIAALARPQKTAGRLVQSGQGIAIMLAIDTSQSMSAIDFAPADRLGAAKDTASRFIEGRAQDRIGAVVFGGAPQLACPLTVDYGALLSELSELYPNMTHAEGTAIGEGIISAVNHLKSSPAKSKVIILLTDGRNNAGLIDPVTAAKTAASFGIKLYAIGTAKRGQALMPVDDPLRGKVLVAIEDDLDEDLLKEVAQITQGSYFRATSLNELKEIYATIDRLEKSEVKLPEIASRGDLYFFPAGLAAILLLLEMAAAGTVLLRWP